MSNTQVINGSGDFNVIFIGGGNVMFGSDEGPWNHSVRFEEKLGPRLKVIAIVDPDIKRVEATLQRKRLTPLGEAYRSTQVFANFADLARSYGVSVTHRDASTHPDDKTTFKIHVHAFVIGVPPLYRGSTQSGRDIEMQVMKHFPGVALFVEKPISVPVNGEEDVRDVSVVTESIRKSGTICSVAYMLRYLKAVQMMKKIIKDNNLTVMITIARFACAYESIGKPDYWFKSRFGGPIMEQATHVCDLARYFGGEIDLSSISATTIEWDEAPGKLSRIDARCLEDEVLPEDKIARATAANWKHENGAIGSLVHAVALHGSDYSCEFEVIADGYMLKLINPYVRPILFVQRPGSKAEEYTFSEDDPYLTEISSFVDAIEKGPGESNEIGETIVMNEGEAKVRVPGILSTYEDACRTYRFTWEIRRQSELAALRKSGKK